MMGSKVSGMKREKNVNTFSLPLSLPVLPCHPYPSSSHQSVLFLDLVWNRPGANRYLLYIAHSGNPVFLSFLLNYFNSFHEHFLRTRSLLGSEAIREIEHRRSALGDLWLQLPWPLMLQSGSYPLVFSSQDHPIGLLLPLKIYEVLKLSPVFQTSLCVWVFHFINVYI